MKFATLSTLLLSALSIDIAFGWNYGSEETYSGTITVTNLAPMGGTCQTPVWVGLHTGYFDVYDRDEPASKALESLAEDGSTAMISTAFEHVVGGMWQGTIARTVMDAPPIICPEQSASMDFEVTIRRGMPLYLSYATMVLPSNDAFLANGDPRAHQVLNSGHRFKFETIVDYGSDVLDAGTEVNDEASESTPLLGQMAPNTGTTEGGVVTLHEGFKDAGEGGILDADGFENADFTANGYMAMKIEVQMHDDNRRLLEKSSSVRRRGD